MKNTSKELLNLAKQVTEIYTTFDGLKAIAIGASISKGQATEFSDIDTIMIWDKIPSDEMLDKAFEHNKGIDRTFMNKSEHGCLELYHVNGTEVQLSHAKPDFYEAVIHEIIENKSMEPLYHLVADGFKTVIPLFGEGYINSVKERLADYPEELAVKTVEKFMRFGSFNELKYRFQKEDNIIWTTDVKSILIKRVIGVLLGVNRMYIPGDFRKIRNVTDAFKIKPENLYSRILKIMSNPGKDILDDLYSLIVETFAIVEEHLPELDISETKSMFLDSPKSM